MSENALQPNGNATSQNLVHIWNDLYVKTGMDDADSAVLLVAPSYNASLIGAGTNGAPLQPLFGNIDFKAYNIDFENRAVCDSRTCCPYVVANASIRVGKLRYQSSPGDRHLIRQCVVLWLRVRELSRYVVYWSQRINICGGQRHLRPDGLYVLGFFPMQSFLLIEG